MKKQRAAARRPSGKKVFVYWIVILLLLALLVTATYTWFALNRTPRVSNIGLNVNAPTGMLLSTQPYGAEWVQRLDYADLVGENAPLRPVTWSNADQCFYAAMYGADGRRSGGFLPLDDENNANRDDVYGYYIKATFYATSDTGVGVSLTHPVQLEDGFSGSGTYLIGTPVWDEENILHSDGGRGAQNAMRVGFRITPLDETGAELTGEQLFYIWEPNCDTHLVGGTELTPEEDEEAGETPEAQAEEEDEPLTDEDGDGVLDGGLYVPETTPDYPWYPDEYIPTPSIDGTEGLIDEEWLICQTTTYWSEADPVQRDLYYQTMGEFTTQTQLFKLNAEQIVRIDLYLWLEGQDVDCDNRIGQEAQVMANIQFDADYGGQSGLVPIP